MSATRATVRSVFVRPVPADQDRQARLHRARRADRPVEVVEAAVVRDHLPVEQAAQQAGGLVEAVEPLAEARPEVDPEGVVLAGVPAAAEPEDEAAPRDVVERRRHLGDDPEVPERRSRSRGGPGGPAW